jgi:predicted transcriptional regulator
MTARHSPSPAADDGSLVGPRAAPAEPDLLVSSNGGTPTAPAADVDRSRSAVPAAIVTRYQAGGTLQEDAAEHGRSTKTGCQAVNEAGVDRRPGDSQPNDTPNEQLLSLLSAGVPHEALTNAVARYQAGRTVAQVAAGLGVSWARTRAFLAVSGVHLRHGGAGRNPAEVTGIRRDTLRAEAVALHRAGEPMCQIALRLGKSDTTIRKLLDEAGEKIVPRPHSGGRKSLTAQERQAVQAQAVALHRDGVSPWAISKALHHGDSTIVALLDEAGVTRRRLVRIPDELRPRLRADAAARYQAGDSLRTIAADLGYRYSTIRKLVEEADVPLRAPGYYPRTRS